MTLENETRSEVVYQTTTLQNDHQKLQLLTPSDTEPNSTSSTSFLYFSAFSASLIIFTCGTAFSWSSPVLPKLNGYIEPENNPLPVPITASQESWIAGLICLGATAGPLIGGKAADKLGRKKTLLLLAVPMFLSYITLALAHHVELFYVARTCLGFATGGVFAVLPMYMGEISEDRNRGTIGCLMGVFISSGLLFSYLIGPFFSVKIFSLLCTLPLVLFFVVYGMYVPESPQYLVASSQIALAEKALLKLRQNNKTAVQNELKGLMSNLSKDGTAGPGLFQDSGLRRGFLVTGGLLVLQQVAGINAVLSFMQSIFDASGSSMSSTISTIIVGIVQLCVTIITSLIVEKLGRKILLLISTTVACLAISSLGVFFYLKQNGANLENISWLPIVSLLAYIIAFNLGLGPLPWAILGELFPNNVKSTASILSTFICFFMAFVVTLIFPLMAQILGMAQIFWFFGGCCALGVVFIFLVVPETKGRTLEEIQIILKGDK